MTSLFGGFTRFHRRRIYTIGVELLNDRHRETDYWWADAAAAAAVSIRHCRRMRRPNDCKTRCRRIIHCTNPTLTPNGANWRCIIYASCQSTTLTTHPAGPGNMTLTQRMRQELLGEYWSRDWCIVRSCDGLSDSGMLLAQLTLMCLYYLPFHNCLLLPLVVNKDGYLPSDISVHTQSCIKIVMGSAVKIARTR